MTSNTITGMIPITLVFLMTVGATAQSMRLVPSASYPTIASAAMAAPPGTIIKIAAGTFHETITDFGAGLVFEGESGGGTLIEGDLQRSSFRLTGTSTLRDLAFHHGIATTSPCGVSTLPLTMQRCQFRYCDGQSYNGPLFASLSRIDAVECRFENCQSLNTLISSGYPTILNTMSRCILRANVCGTLLKTAGRIDNSLILDNLASGALVDLAGAGNVEFCTIVNNSAAIAVMGTSSAANGIYSSIVRRNLAAPGPETANCQIQFSNVAGVGLSPGNFDIDPTFFNEQVGNYRLHPFSVSIDTGRLPILISNVIDLDGFTRNVGYRTDQGCYEYGGPDPGPSFNGTATTFLPQVGESPILRVNGTDGHRNHVVAVMAGESIQISLFQPNLQIPANFVLWGQFGFPDAFNPIAIPHTNAGLIVVTPQYLDPFNPALFTLGDSLVPSNGVYPATLAPWVIQGTAMPLFAPFALQGIVENGSGGWEITNCVVVFIGPS